MAKETSGAQPLRTGTTPETPALRSDNPLSDFITLRDVAKQLGASYYTAYGMGACGQLGDPIMVGRTQLYPRATAERAIRQRLARGAVTQHTGSPPKAA